MTIRTATGTEQTEARAADAQDRPAHRLGAVRVFGRLCELTGRLVRRRGPTEPLYAVPIGGARPEPTGSEYGFAFLGDSRDNNGVLERVICGAAEAGNTLAFHAGDITAHGEQRSYRMLVETILRASEGRLAVYPVLGNHDRNATLLGAKRKTNYRMFFGRPSYVVPYGPDAFVVFDDVGFTAENAAALEPMLASARAQARHLFAVFHTPPADPRKDGYHCLGPGAAARLMALMHKYDVAMMLCSHIHGYWMTHVEGIPLVVSGGAGSRLAPGQRYHWVQVSVNDGGASAREVPVG